MALFACSVLFVLLLADTSLLASGQDQQVPQAELDAYRNNPIQQAWYRVMPACPKSGRATVKVPTRVVAHLTTKINSGARVNFGSQATKIMGERCSETKDERGHLVAAMFNGPPAWYNLVPQHHTVNRNKGQSQGAGSKLLDQWVEMETEARQWISGGPGRWVRWTVVVDYNANEPRPTQFRAESAMFERGSNTPQMGHGSRVAVINTGSDAFFIRA